MANRTLPARTTLKAITSPWRAAIYGRASSDPKRRGRSIKDQFAVAELDCHEQGWNIVGYYEDRDRSASRRATKVREDYERLVADVEAGLIDVIVYAERSRANRNMDAFVKLRALCSRAGTRLSYGGRVYDMRKPSDRKEATRDALQSEEEAETIIERAERTARLNASRGTPHGRVPFGFVRKYDPDDGSLLGQFAHPEHASIVKDLFARAAARESLVSLTEFMGAHIPDITRRGVRYMLMNKSYIAVRTHHGQDMDECSWKALVKVEVFDAVQAILSEPDRYKIRDGGVRHLLTGIVQCSVCLSTGAAKRGMRVARINGALRYMCTDGGHVLIREDVLDAFVEAAVFAWLASDAAVATFRVTPDAREEDRVRARIRNMQAQLATARERAGEFDEEGNPALTIESLAATERQLLPQIAKDEEKLRVLTAVQDPMLSRMVGASLSEISECWNDEFLLPQRRHVLRQVVNVTLNRASSRGVKWLDPDRVTLVFAGQKKFRPHASARGSFT